MLLKCVHLADVFRVQEPLSLTWNNFHPIESTTTTSMEDVGTGVLEKIKNIQIKEYSHKAKK